ncbi:DUF1501 domain-containing protein [Xanthocytophaga agilis]|uniref:DUF1501 domain-containing protein n=1 Tax=Xanthocytophaga agilis TaxID=3048010 RepID=A0AAE3UGZ1_9BACT|nr:DUF1501 domain-containing protein [Xanthocytophaga agilis]MDJ1502937.1 DUF1501 domain-containing protein [Xanthocytophaga agilis]
MNPLFLEAIQRQTEYMTRRHFLSKCTTGIGAMALASLTGCFADKKSSQEQVSGIVRDLSRPFAPLPSHFAPKAKRVIFLHMAGAPSQLELFDYKPELQKLDGQLCPPSLLEGKRFAFIKGVPKMLGPQALFKQYGQSGTWVSHHLPEFASMVDDVSFLKAMHTDQFNHAPAQLLIQTGNARLGRPSMGAWVTYGLGSENENLPGFIVLLSGGKAPDAGKAGYGSGFLPTVYQGVECRSKGEPVLYVANPEGMDRDLRKASLQAINDINRIQHEETGDPETISRISQYEMAFKMQISVPEVMDIKDEPQWVHEMYGTEPGKSSFANNCLLARRLTERGVRFVQLFDWGWDSHGNDPSNALDKGFSTLCHNIDKPITALLKDLKMRGLLDETLVVWGAEFGRTPMQENREGKQMEFKGRDHHTEAFTVWMAGGGIKSGYTHGETDEIGYYGIKDRTDIYDLQATILHCLGFNHEKLTYPFQGRNFRLTDVHGKVITKILA